MDRGATENTCHRGLEREILPALEVVFDHAPAPIIEVVALVMVPNGSRHTIFALPGVDVIPVHFTISTPTDTK